MVSSYSRFCLLAPVLNCYQVFPFSVQSGARFVDGRPRITDYEEEQEEEGVLLALALGEFGEQEFWAIFDADSPIRSSLCPFPNQPANPIIPVGGGLCWRTAALNASSVLVFVN